MNATIRYTVYTRPNAHRNFIAHAKRVARWVYGKTIKPARIEGEYRKGWQFKAIYDRPNDRVQVAYFYVGDSYVPVSWFRVGLDIMKGEE